jgi:2-alkyl-3-oxoalkanoate reductase
MNVFVAGATGTLGRALVPQLVARGHEVVGMTRAAYEDDSLDMHWGVLVYCIIKS